MQNYTNGYSHTLPCSAQSTRSTIKVSSKINNPFGENRLISMVGNTVNS